MKLLADENFPYKSIQYLRAIGYDVYSVSMDNPSIKDIEIIMIAINEGRIILTFDRDFGELIFKHNQRPENGVIYLRFEEFAPHEPALIIKQLLENKELDLTRALTVVDKNGIRQRKY